MIVERHPVRQSVWAQCEYGLHPIGRLAVVPRVCALAGGLLLALALSGCRHKPVRSPLPIGALAPIALETEPPDQNPPEIASLSLPDFGPLPDIELPPPRRRAPAAPKETKPAQPPAQIASNDAAAALAIGSLSLGGEDTAHTPQQAQDLINAVLKRIAGLSSAITAAQKREVRQARNYLDQAQKTLRTGDAEGAHTLATKASLLMDEIEKK